MESKARWRRKILILTGSLSSPLERFVFLGGGGGGRVNEMMGGGVAVINGGRGLTQDKGGGIFSKRGGLAMLIDLFDFAFPA